MYIGNWIINDQITRGSYGTIYNVKNISKISKQNYIIKISNDKNFQEHLKELNFYRKFKKYQGKCLPKLRDFGYHNGKYYIILEKLNKIGKLYNIRKIIELLFLFSKYDIIHGDIKPDNIMNREIKKENTTVLIDWGLSCNLNSKNDVPSGTPLYMSIMAHEGKISLRNDLESLLYCILHEISDLEWKDDCFMLLNNNDNYSLMEKIKNKKILFSKKILEKNNNIMIKYKFYKLSNLYKFAVYIFSLKRTDTPDYNILTGCFPV